MTAGILLPAFVMIYFDMLSVGLVLSLGALGVSGTDSAGPIQHRRDVRQTRTIEVRGICLPDLNSRLSRLSFGL